MKLHEYQAKELLAAAGANVPRGIVASTPAEAQQAFDKLGGPVVLKAQVHAGGRGKGHFKGSGKDWGGVKFVKDRDTARQVAEVMFQYPLVTKQTGEAHWHVLQRARAIETGCFVFSAAQGGRHEDGRDTFGHSLVIDPWGRILAEGGSEPGVVLAKVDPAEVAKARARIPSLQHGRCFEIVAPAPKVTPLHAVGGDR